MSSPFARWQRKLLEEILGVSLFIRQNRQIDLTPEGRRFKRYTERLIAKWRKARHDVALLCNINVCTPMRSSLFCVLPMPV